MEQLLINKQDILIADEVINRNGEVINLSTLKPSSDKCFIEANTIQSSLDEIKNDHIIPVFIKDNNTLISHSDFVETTMDIVQKYYAGETILRPNIRLSHPIKGRIPSAKNKPANELLEYEKTLFY